jgi:hypothetical protein
LQFLSDLIHKYQDANKCVKGADLMLLGPHDIARRLEYQHRPGWVVWWGEHTRQYWALATWIHTPYGMLCAATPEALDAAIATFEMFHPQPHHQHAHALGH